MEHHESIVAAEPVPVPVHVDTPSSTFEDMSASTASPPSSGRSTPFSTMSDMTSTSSTSDSTPPSPSSATAPSDKQHHPSLQRQSSVQNLRDKRASFFNRRDIVVSDMRYFGGRNTTTGDYTNVAWSASSSATFPRVRMDPNARSRFQNLLAHWKSRDTPASSSPAASPPSSSSSTSSPEQANEAAEQPATAS